MVDTQRPATTITGPVSLNEMVRYTYDRWMESVGIPIHKGYFVEDLRTVPLARWDERECDACFIQLAGQEGVSEARVTEIRPGATLPPMKLTIDEAAYVCSGRGLTTVWADGGGKKSPLPAPALIDNMTA